MKADSICPVQSGDWTLNLSTMKNQVMGQPVGLGETSSGNSHLPLIWFHVHQAVFRWIISLPVSLILGRRMCWWEACEFWSLEWDPLLCEWRRWCLVNILVYVSWEISNVPCSHHPWVLCITDSCLPIYFPFFLINRIPCVHLKILTSPDSLAAEGNHVPQFWPMQRRWKSLGVCLFSG